MVFSSLTFLFLFLPLVLLLYFIVDKKYKNIILLIFSLIFYSWGEPKYIILMIVSIIVNYFLAILMDKKTKKISSKLILILCIVFNISLLLFFKYTNFLVFNLNNIFGINIRVPEIILPIGISFYTFQILSYVVDVYRKEVKVQKNILNLATYVTLFPQLIAGPIVRYSTIEDELNNRKSTLKKVVEGSKRFIIGLGKKVILANNLAIIADQIIDSVNLTSYGSIIAWIGMIAYTLQIYYDFSGYSDMAIGLGKIFGFEFLENFNYPYISKSITDFWRRWHISLSSWFRDYVYIPLGGNRVSKIKWFRNIAIVWLLTGLWHGASWNFVLWGAYFGVILMLEKLFLLKIINKLPKYIQWLYSFILIIIGWTIFRNIELSSIYNTLSAMFSINLIDFPKFIQENYNLFNYLPYLILGLIGMTPVIKKLLDKFNNNNNYLSFIYDFFILGIFILSVFFLIKNTYNPFIYFRF